jgi:hypothetical protein
MMTVKPLQLLKLTIAPVIAVAEVGVVRTARGQRHGAARRNQVTAATNNETENVGGGRITAAWGQGSCGAPVLASAVGLPPPV